MIEKNLSMIRDTYNSGIAIVLVIFSILFLIRLITTIRFKKNRSWLIQHKGEWFVIILKFLFAIAMICFLIDVPIWFITVAQFRIIVNPFLYNSLLFILVSIAIQELILCFTISNSLLNGFIKRMVFLLIAGFCLLSFGAACFIAPTTYDYPSEENCLNLELPVKGSWYALHAGEQPWVNYHSAYYPQRYAIDMVKLDQVGNFFMGKGEECKEFLSFGDSVFAPIGGTVFNLADSFLTQKVLQGTDTLNPAGNFVEIQINDSQYLFLAHLLEHSIPLKKGDTLHTNQFIGLSGNSGNTTWPHLHMHVQNKPQLNDSLTHGLPFRFNQIYRKRWFSFSEENHTALIRNDQFYQKR